MPRTCVYPGCWNLDKAVRLRVSGSIRDGQIMFHKFPVNDPYRLMLWLLAIGCDVNTPLEKIIKFRICSEHFKPDDYKTNEGTRSRFLKSTTVPVTSTFSHKREPSLTLPETDIDEDTKDLEVTECLVSDPESTPVKLKSFEQDEDTEAALVLMLKSPASIPSKKCPSTSGTYIALPPIRSCYSDKPPQTSTEYDDLDSRMQSTEKCNIDFVPSSSTSTSTSTSTFEEDTKEGILDERKWIVNESSLIGLFKRCQECGAFITETKQLTKGSLIQVQWECENKHKGQWTSCADVWECL